MIDFFLELVESDHMVKILPVVPISRADVEHVAKLARLGLTGQEVEKFRQELASVLSYVAKLNKVNTKGVPATAQVTGLSNVFREDSIKKCDIPLEELLKNAPAKNGRYWKVKAVLEEQP